MKRTSLPLRRREVVAGLAGAAAAWPIGARAQRPERMRRIGVLMHTTPDEPESQLRLEAFLQGRPLNILGLLRG